MVIKIVLTLMTGWRQMCWDLGQQGLGDCCLLLPPPHTYKPAIAMLASMSPAFSCLIFYLRTESISVVGLQIFWPIKLNLFVFTWKDNLSHLESTRIQVA